MKKINQKELAKDLVAKMLADKALVRSYIKGEITLQTLTQKGIKIAKPL